VLADIKWVRNIAFAGISVAAFVIPHPERWRIALLWGAGFYAFSCLVDLAIAKFLRPKLRRIMKLRCMTCTHTDKAMCFYFVWYPGCPGPEPVKNPVYRCPSCGSESIEEPAP